MCVRENRACAREGCGFGQTLEGRQGQTANSEVKSCSNVLSFKIANCTFNNIIDIKKKKSTMPEDEQHLEVNFKYDNELKDEIVIEIPPSKIFKKKKNNEMNEKYGGFHPQLQVSRVINF